MNRDLVISFAIASLVHVGALLPVGWSNARYDVERSRSNIEVSLVSDAPSVSPAINEPAALQLEPRLVSTPSYAAIQPTPQPASQQPAAPTIESVPGGITEAKPAYLRNQPPAYPLLARLRGEEGTVLLEALVLPDGRCGEVTIHARSGFPDLDQAAQHAVRRWHFLPARRAGIPIASKVLIPIRFSLQSTESNQ